MESYDQIINTELFEVIVTEIYNKKIPKYFTTPQNGDLPRLNGIKVSWEEYLEARPDAERDQEFIPDMIYTPSEMNQTISMSTAAGIIDYLDNELDVQIAYPDKTYPRLIAIISGYIEMAQTYITTNSEIRTYIEKARRALTIISKSYERYVGRQESKTLAFEPNKKTFDKLEKKFMGA